MDTSNPTDEKRRQGDHLTAAERAKVQARFLTAYAKTGIILRASKAAKVDRTTVYYWQEHDEHFALRMNQARAEADDALREEIRRRAVTGTLKPVYQGGHFVGTIREYSDTLLIFLAKSRMPEFREKVEHSGEVRLTVEMLDKVLADAGD